MPYQKLIKMERFSELRIKQLWDECRIFAAWYSFIKRKAIVHDKKTKKILTLEDCIKHYAHARGLLLALGYVVKKEPSSKKTTPEFKEMFKRAWPRVKKWYAYYKNKVSRINKT